MPPAGTGFDDLGPPNTFVAKLMARCVVRSHEKRVSEMEAITTLVDEHRVLEEGLNALEVVTQQTEAGRLPPALKIQQLLDFFTDFADERHHRKEEAVLIPNLEQTCGGRYLCPHSDTLDRMQKEHKSGHRLIGAMRDALPKAGKDPVARKMFLEAAQTYVRMQREHIQLEEEDLFPEADAILVGHDADLIAAYEKRATEAGESRTLQDFQEIVDTIVAGVEPLVATPAST